MKQYQGETLKEYINRFGAQVVKFGTTEEPMIVYAFRKGVCSGPFCESIIRNRPKTFAEIRRRTVEHITSEGEVYEMHKCCAHTPKSTDACATRQGQRGHDGKEEPGEDAPTRQGNRPLRHNFVVEQKDLIVVPNIADRLRPPLKSDKVLGPHRVVVRVPRGVRAPYQ